jgi:hypothetical protein
MLPLSLLNSYSFQWHYLDEVTRPRWCGFYRRIHGTGSGFLEGLCRYLSDFDIVGKRKIRTVAYVCLQIYHECLKHYEGVCKQNFCSEVTVWESAEKIQIRFKLGKNVMHFTWRTKYVSLLLATLNCHESAVFKWSDIRLLGQRRRYKHYKNTPQCYTICTLPALLLLGIKDYILWDSKHFSFKMLEVSI